MNAAKVSKAKQRQQLVAARVWKQERGKIVYATNFDASEQANGVTITLLLFSFYLQW